MEECYLLEPVQSLVPVNSVEKYQSTISQKYWHIICKYTFHYLEHSTSSLSAAPVSNSTYSSSITITDSSCLFWSKWSPWLLRSRKILNFPWNPHLTITNRMKVFLCHVDLFLLAMECLSFLNALVAFLAMPAMLIPNTNADSSNDTLWIKWPIL